MISGADEDAATGADRAADVRARALHGGMLVTLRGFAVRTIGFVSSLVVVRFVSPEEFGIFGIGLTFLTAGTLLADAGLAASLVRGADEPDRLDLAAVQAFQLAASLVVVAAAFGIGSFFVTEALLVAVMPVSLPVTTLRVPALTNFERHLDYAPVVRVEVIETLAYSAFLLTGLILGGGIWVLALAIVFRALVGTVVLARLSPVGLVAPVPSWKRVRPILGFGAQFTGISGIQAGADQLFNVGITAVAGLAVLGLWGVAYRLLQIPQIVFLSLRRVSYPAMARLLDTGEEIRPTIERTVRLAATASGIVLAPLIAGCPGLIPIVFGERWRDAAEALPGACLGLMIAGPVSLGVASFLLARGHAGIVLRATIVRVVTMLVISISLVNAIGVAALGLGYLVAAVLEMLMLGVAARRESGADLLRSLLPTVAIGITSAAAGWILTTEAGGTALATGAGIAVSLTCFAVLSWLFTRAAVLDLYYLARRPLVERFATA